MNEQIAIMIQDANEMERSLASFKAGLSTGDIKAVKYHAKKMSLIMASLKSQSSALRRVLVLSKSRLGIPFEGEDVPPVESEQPVESLDLSSRPRRAAGR